jgi:hypothetical protein
MGEHEKIFFELKQDDDGYPPVAAESVWALATERSHEYTIDNIPFFATQATSGDLVRAREGDGGVLWFESVLKSSGKSLLRATFFMPDKFEEVRATLRRLGCATEWDDVHQLLAMSVPPDVKLSTVQDYLAGQAEAGHLDYEEPLLRQ